MARTLLLVVALTLLAGRTEAAAKRPLPDYGGPQKDTSPGQVLLWVPRVALYPVWLVNEYAIRRPMGALVTVAERDQWPVQVIDFFTFGDRDQVMLFPSALFDFGLKPSVGLNLSWKYFLAEPNTLHAHFGTWGPDWISAKLADDYALNRNAAATFDAAFHRRKDIPFYGLGPRSGSDVIARYQTNELEVAGGYQLNFWRSSSFASRTGLRALGFGAGTCCGEQSLRSAVASGEVPAPPGFDRGYAAAFQRLSFAIDSRRRQPENGTGFHVDAYGDATFAPAKNADDRRSWLGYGGSAGFAWDFWHARTVGLGVAADLVDPLQGSVPFTAQVSLGGERPMRGYLRDRLLDRSSLVGSLQYSWPIWAFLNGAVHTEIGNVFGARFEGFEARLMRLSGSIGVESSADPDSRFEVMVAAATDPLEHGFNVSSFRLLFGSHHGF